MSQDIVADGINSIMNAKKAGKKKFVLDRYSNLLIEILKIAKNKGYVENYSVEENKVEIEIGNLHECKAIKPRFFVDVRKIQDYRERYLPSRNFGDVIISTNKGLMTDEKAEKENIGGSLIAYFY